MIETQATEYSAPILERQLPTPANWHWAITPEDVEKIKANDRETINRVYLRNIDKFRGCAFNFCYRHCCRDMAEDCAQQIYVDMAGYCYDNVKTFFRGIRRSFFSAILLHKRATFSLDAPITLYHRSGDADGFGTLADFISVDGFADWERSFHAKSVFEIIDEQKSLTPSQKDVLIAIAFDIKPWEGLYEYARTHVDISKP